MNSFFYDHLYFSVLVPAMSSSICWIRGVGISVIDSQSKSINSWLTPIRTVQVKRAYFVSKNIKYGMSTQICETVVTAILTHVCLVSISWS